MFSLCTVSIHSSFNRCVRSGLQMILKNQHLLSLIYQEFEDDFGVSCITVAVSLYRTPIQSKSDCCGFMIHGSAQCGFITR